MQHRSSQNLCCGDTTKLQHAYYANQAGGALAHFSGGEFQRGHGLGTVISGFLKRALPLLPATFTKSLKRKALKAGLGVAGDLLRGKSLKTAVKDRALETIGFGGGGNDSVKKPTLRSSKRPTTTIKPRPIKRPAPNRRVSFGPAVRGRASRYRNTVLQ
jgi:hypothetical protein